MYRGMTDIVIGDCCESCVTLSVAHMVYISLLVLLFHLL